MRCILYSEKNGKRSYKTVNIPIPWNEDGNEGMPDDYRELNPGPVHYRAELDPIPLEITERIIVYRRKEIVDPFLEVLWYEYHKEGCRCGVCLQDPDLLTGYCFSSEEIFERAMIWDLFDRDCHSFARWDSRIYFVIFSCEESRGDWIVESLPRLKRTETIPGDRGTKTFVLSVEGLDRAEAYAAHVNSMGSHARAFRPVD